MKKLLQVVLFMTLGLFFTSTAFAQQGLVKVANNSELIQALNNSDVQFVEITQDGFYDEILMDAKAGTVIDKGSGGTRGECTTAITRDNKCFETPTTINLATAALSGPDCPGQPSGDVTLGWSSPDAEVAFDFGAMGDQWTYAAQFTTTGPGNFTIMYKWDHDGTESSTHVYLYGSGEITELSAATDVCGLTVPVTFNYTMGPESGTPIVEWTLDGNPYAGPTDPGTFDLTVTSCGLHTLEVSLSNQHGCSPVTDDVTVEFNVKPTVDAGSDNSVCGTEYTLNGTASVPTGCGTVTNMVWTVSADTPGPTLNGNVATVTDCGEYDFVFSAANGTCVDSDTVTISFVTEPTVEAGDDFSTCGVYLVDPDPNAGEFRGYGTLKGSYTAQCLAGNVNVGWSLWDGPTGASVTYVQSQSVDTTDIVVNMCGTYKFLLQVWNGPVGSSCESSDTVTFVFYDEPVVIAGADTSVCGLDVTLSPTFTTVCTNGGTLDPVWSLVSGPTGGTLVSSTNDVLTVSTCGTYEFMLEVTNTECTGSDNIVVEFFDTPLVDAGIDVDICGNFVSPGVYLGLATLAGSYDASCGGSVPAISEWNYSYVGPGAGLLDFVEGQDQLTTDIRAHSCGIYTFWLDIYTMEGTDTICTGADTTVYWFYDMPEIFAGNDTAICGLTTSLTPTWDVVCDNGNTVTTSWTLFTGPGNAVFTGDDVEVTDCGTYQLIYSVTNTACTALDTVTVEFFETPVVDAGLDGDTCGLLATLTGSYTLACSNAGAVTSTWAKVKGPGAVIYNPGADALITDIEVASCGEYEFELKVFNGACTSVDIVALNFFDTPVITMMDVPQIVCGFETNDFYAYYSVACNIGDVDNAWWVADTPGGAIVAGTGTDSFKATADDCGTYEFTYWVENGPCLTSETISITFYAVPDPVITGPDTVYACATEEYCVTDASCNADADVTFVWTVSGGLFGNGFNVATATCVDVTWDNDFNTFGLLVVHAQVDAVVDECHGEDDMEVKKLQPTFEGQVKYWNAFETYMPTPFPTDFYGTFPEDYFYVTLYLVDAQSPDGLLEMETVNVMPRLMEDLRELMSYFDFDIDTYTYGCDAEYVLKIWDGGLSYHTGTPPPPVSGTYLGASYTYTNWGGVNATDALAIQLMAVNDDINPDNGFTWVGMDTTLPIYGYYSNGVANVNSSVYGSGITALDALTANYRSVGLLGSYPSNDTNYTNQFNPNFMVTGRMVDSLPEITFDANASCYFDTAINMYDVPFAHSGADYEYFTDATTHKYTSVTLPWEGKANYMNIYYEAIGDVNANYVPTSGGFKAEPTMQLTYEGMVSTSVDRIMTIPMTVDRDVEVGAITLSFTYRNDLIEVIETNFSDDNVFIDNEEGILNIGWFSMDSRDIEAGETVAQITVRVLAEIPENTELFELNVNTELADATATALDVNLKSIGISTDKGVNTSELVISNYPNPFADATTITYTLPENGKVKVEVYNNMGVLVTTLLDETQESGTQSLVFDLDVKPGVYMYSITLSGELNDYSSVKRMIVVK